MARIILLSGDEVAEIGAFGGGDERGDAFGLEFEVSEGTGRSGASENCFEAGANALLEEDFRGYEGLGRAGWAGERSKRGVDVKNGGDSRLEEGEVLIKGRGRGGMEVRREDIIGERGGINGSEGTGKLDDGHGTLLAQDGNGGVESIMVREEGNGPFNWGVGALIRLGDEEIQGVAGSVGGEVDVLSEIKGGKGAAEGGRVGERVEVNVEVASND